MAAASPRVQAMEARDEREKILDSIQEKLRHLSMAVKGLSHLTSEAEAEAALAKWKEVVAVFMRASLRLSSELHQTSDDYSGMTEEKRAMEAERLRQATTMESREKAGLRPWQVQVMEARDKEKIVDSIKERLRGLGMAAKDLSSCLSEAEEAAARAKLNELVVVLTRASARIYFEIKEPDYSGMTEDERAAEAERLRQEELEEAKRVKLGGELLKGLAMEGRARILDFDPKQGGPYYNRFPFFDDSPPFNLDEESRIGPRRFTTATYEKGTSLLACMAINILSVKISCSDVGSPIQVYGSVIARDSTDFKCLYIFRRDRDHCQLINSEDEPLILTGPNRGLAILDYNYVETDLKIKDHQGKDRELSKGLLAIRGIRAARCEVETESIATRLSTVDVMYAVVPYAVEGSIEVRVIEGQFDGTITANTTSFQERIVVYDSKVAGTIDPGPAQLLRPAVSVYLKDKLIIDAKTSSGEFKSLKFTPAFNGIKNHVITLGATKMRLMVAWSIMEPCM